MKDLHQWWWWWERELAWPRLVLVLLIVEDDNPLGSLWIPTTAIPHAQTTCSGGGLTGIITHRSATDGDLLGVQCLVGPLNDRSSK
jgi:hypothetical protein